LKDLALSTVPPRRPSVITNGPQTPAMICHPEQLNKLKPRPRSTPVPLFAIPSGKGTKCTEVIGPIMFAPLLYSMAVPDFCKYLYVLSVSSC
jgi:hypothetical protein